MLASKASELQRCAQHDEGARPWTPPKRLGDLKSLNKIAQTLVDAANTFVGPLALDLFDLVQQGNGKHKAKKTDV